MSKEEFYAKEDLDAAVPCGVLCSLSIHLFGYLSCTDRYVPVYSGYRGTIICGLFIFGSDSSNRSDTYTVQSFEMVC